MDPYDPGAVHVPKSQCGCLLKAQVASHSPFLPQVFAKAKKFATLSRITPAGYQAETLTPDMLTTKRSNVGSDRTVVASS